MKTGKECKNNFVTVIEYFFLFSLLFEEEKKDEGKIRGKRGRRKYNPKRKSKGKNTDT